MNRPKKGYHYMPDGTIMKDSDHLPSRANGGVADTLQEIYDLRETYPTQFENAVNSFKGEMGKIWDFWKDTFGFRRGGHVGFRK